jgi:hypothetical protein
MRGVAPDLPDDVIAVRNGVPRFIKIEYCRGRPRAATVTTA